MKIWLAKFVRLWNILSYQGLQKDARVGPEEYRIILINRLAFVGAVVSFVYAIYFQKFHASYLYIVEAILVLCYLSCILFNRFRHHRAAKFLIILFTLVNVFINASSLGRDGGDHLIFIPIFFGIPLIHGSKNKSDITISMIMTFIAYALLEYSNYSLFSLESFISQEELIWNYRANMLLVFILSLMINYYYSLVKNKQHEEITDAEKKLMAVFNQAYDAIFLIERENLIIQDCSIKALILFKVKNKQELVGKPIHSLFKKKLSAQALSRLRKRLQQGGKWHKELECVTANKGEFLGQCSCFVH